VMAEKAEPSALCSTVRSVSFGLCQRFDLFVLGPGQCSGGPLVNIDSASRFGVIGRRESKLQAENTIDTFIRLLITLKTNKRFWE